MNEVSGAKRSRKGRRHNVSGAKRRKRSPTWKFGELDSHFPKWIERAKASSSVLPSSLSSRSSSADGAATTFLSSDRLFRRIDALLDFLEALAAELHVMSAAEIITVYPTIGRLLGSLVSCPEVVIGPASEHLIRCLVEVALKCADPRGQPPPLQARDRPNAVGIVEVSVGSQRRMSEWAVKCLAKVCNPSPPPPSPVPPLSLSSVPLSSLSAAATPEATSAEDRMMEFLGVTQEKRDNAELQAAISSLSLEGAPSTAVTDQRLATLPPSVVSSLPSFLYHLSSSLPLMESVALYYCNNNSNRNNNSNSNGNGNDNGNDINQREAQTGCVTTFRGCDTFLALVCFSPHRQRFYEYFSLGTKMVMWSRFRDVFLSEILDVVEWRHLHPYAGEAEILNNARVQQIGQGCLGQPLLFGELVRVLRHMIIDTRQPSLALLLACFRIQLLRHHTGYNNNSNGNTNTNTSRNSNGNSNGNSNSISNSNSNNNSSSNSNNNNMNSNKPNNGSTSACHARPSPHCSPSVFFRSTFTSPLRIDSLLALLNSTPHANTVPLVVDRITWCVDQLSSLSTLSRTDSLVDLWSVLLMHRDWYDVAVMEIGRATATSPPAPASLVDPDPSSPSLLRSCCVFVSWMNNPVASSSHRSAYVRWLVDNFLPRVARWCRCEDDGKSAAILRSIVGGETEPEESDKAEWRGSFADSHAHFALMVVLGSVRHLSFPSVFRTRFLWDRPLSPSGFLLLEKALTTFSTKDARCVEMFCKCIHDRVVQLWIDANREASPPLPSSSSSSTTSGTTTTSTTTTPSASSSTKLIDRPIGRCARSIARRCRAIMASLAESAVTSTGALNAMEAALLLLDEMLDRSETNSKREESRK